MDADAATAHEPRPGPTPGDRLLVVGGAPGGATLPGGVVGAGWAEVRAIHDDPADRPGASVDIVLVVEPYRPSDPVRAISEMHRVLVPGGLMAIAGPADAPWREALRRSALFAPVEPPPSADADADRGKVAWARRRGPARPGREGVVAFVHTSPGGVPKRPVERAWAHRLGVDGDGHVYRGHGGEDAAVCLLAQEAIERVRADGHGLFPGAVGENVTVLGIDWAALRARDRLVFGSGLELELTGIATPCQTIAHWFTRRRIARIGEKRHPADARWYARVLAEGMLEPGDTIRHEPAAASAS